MRSNSSSAQGDLHNWLLGLGFHQMAQENTGDIFLNKKDDICLIIDTAICTLADYPYVAYTSRQNDLMATHSQVFRFLFDRTSSVQQIKEDILIFLNGESDPEQITRFGGNRAEQQPDPTLPEATFEDCFLEAFGDRARMGLHREFAYIDAEGSTRYIDYALFAASGKFAIELNGESFHHPVVIGPGRYRSQLFKQNSLVADGFKVYRWSLNGMRDRERFILEITRFMGHAQPFIDKPVFKLTRRVETLYKHQHQALDMLSAARRKGRHTFLLVLPTGTGKTEIFIEDIVRLKEQKPGLKALIIVPTRNLRNQTLARLRLRLPPHLQGLTSD
jgi:hypothetical protein